MTPLKQLQSLLDLNERAANMDVERFKARTGDIADEIRFRGRKIRASIANATRVPRGVVRAALEPNYTRIKYQVERSVNKPKEALEKAILPKKETARRSPAYKGFDTAQTKVRIARHARQHGVDSAFEYARSLGSAAPKEAIRKWMLNRYEEAEALRKARAEARKQGGFFRELSGANRAGAAVRDAARKRNMEDRNAWLGGYHGWKDRRGREWKSLRKTILKNPRHPEHEVIQRQWAARSRNA